MEKFSVLLKILCYLHGFHDVKPLQDLPELNISLSVVQPYNRGIWVMGAWKWKIANVRLLFDPLLQWHSLTNYHTLVCPQAIAMEKEYTEDLTKELAGIPYSASLQKNPQATSMIVEEGNDAAKLQAAEPSITEQPVTSEADEATRMGRMMMTRKSRGLYDAAKVGMLFVNPPTFVCDIIMWSITAGGLRSQ
jgi:hypothetical protein